MVDLSSSFETECEIIDRDHRRLVEMVNAIVAAIDGDHATECATRVPKFVKFAKQHFVREEAFLADIGYPETQKHHDHHRALDGKMATILGLAAKAADNQLAREALKKDLVFFLMDDVINADLDFKPFIKVRKT
ncbi:MAG: hemerythrin domain-containing protein [Rhodospirillales bacterium]|nr:hemerythrin domain-containing protein [Rhodospirillales bacterium]